MSERFESILAFDDNIWCKSSPVLIEKGALLKDTYSNKLLIQLKFMNISSNTIAGLNLRIACRSKLSNTSINVDFSYTDFNAEKGDYFGDRVPLYLPNSNLREFDFIVTKVIFKNGKQWNNEEIFYPIPKESTDINVLGDLKEQFKRDIWDIYKKEQKRIVTQTVYMPVFKHDYWLCTCGAFNLSEENECCKCGISKKSLSEAVNIENITENQNLYNLKIQEETKRVNEINRKRIKKLLISLIGLVIIIILLFVGKAAVTSISRSNDYNKAVELFNEKEYQKSYNLFTSLGNYKDTNNYLHDILYLWNGVWYNEANPENNMTIETEQKENEMFVNIDFNERYGKTIQVNCKRSVKLNGNNIHYFNVKDDRNFYNIKVSLNTDNLITIEIEGSKEIQTYIYRK